MATCVRYLIVAAALLSCGCKRHENPPPRPRAETSLHQTDGEMSPSLAGAGANARPAFSPSAGEPRVLSSRVVYATWYDVPVLSLAARRAGIGELTAAHNHLPLGTKLRVTHLANGRSVIVRVTDRGILAGHTKLDLCRAAAEKLGMTSEGIARVRMEVLDEEKSSIAAGASETGSPATSH